MFARSAMKPTGARWSSSRPYSRCVTSLLRLPDDVVVNLAFDGCCTRRPRGACKRRSSSRAQSVADSKTHPTPGRAERRCPRPRSRPPPRRETAAETRGAGSARERRPAAPGRRPLLRAPDAPADIDLVHAFDPLPAGWSCSGIKGRGRGFRVTTPQAPIHPQSPVRSLHPALRQSCARANARPIARRDPVAAAPRAQIARSGRARIHRVFRRRGAPSPTTPRRSLPPRASIRARFIRTTDRRAF